MNMFLPMVEAPYKQGIALLSPEEDISLHVQVVQGNIPE
jgi:hypothetical protein